MIDLDVDWLFSQPTWKIGSQTQREMVVRLKISDDKNLSEYSRFSIRKIFKITQNYSGDLNFDKLGYFENHIMYQKHIFIPNDIRSKNCKWIKVNVSRNTFCERFESGSKGWFLCEREMSVYFRFRHTCPTSRSFRYGWFWNFATLWFGIFGFGEPNFFFSAPNLKLKNDQTESIAVSNWSKLI